MLIRTFVTSQPRRGGKSSPGTRTARNETSGERITHLYSQAISHRNPGITCAGNCARTHAPIVSPESTMYAGSPTL